MNSYVIFRKFGPFQGTIIFAIQFPKSLSLFIRLVINKHAFSSLTLFMISYRAEVTEVANSLWAHTGIRFEPQTSLADGPHLLNLLLSFHGGQGVLSKMNWHSTREGENNDLHFHCVWSDGKRCHLDCVLRFFIASLIDTWMDRSSNIFNAFDHMGHSIGTLSIKFIYCH